MWWVALYLPQLSLESFMAGVPDCPPACALVYAHRIQEASPAAQAAGVLPGLKKATALALVPELLCGQASAQRDAWALQRVAHVALTFTPSVSIQPQGCPADGWRSRMVWLEVQASLRYFGGLPRLCRQLQAALQPLGHAVHWGVAPTPGGAAALARADLGRVLPGASPSWTQGSTQAGDWMPATSLPQWWAIDLPHLQAALDAAPAALWAHSSQAQALMEEMGLRTGADLRRQPRAALSRRLGPQCLDALDRALGLQPDPHTWFVPTEQFEQSLELPARADTTDELWHGAHMLLDRLHAWARARQVQVQRFSLSLQHETRQRKRDDSPPRSELTVALSGPEADLAHGEGLLRERLARTVLPAPVLGLSLRCDAWVAGVAPSGELFPSPQSQREGLTRLIERLQARLGPQAVCHLQPRADHRPEQSMAWHCAEPAASASAKCGATPPQPNVLGVRSVATRAGAGAPPACHWPAAGVRPVWMLEPPQPLPQRQGGPCWQGRPVQLLSGPERIEAGWWDGALAQRDYFIAQAHDGSLLWLYCSRHAGVPAMDAEGLTMEGEGIDEVNVDRVNVDGVGRAEAGAIWGLPRTEDETAAQDSGWFLQGRFA